MTATTTKAARFFHTQHKMACKDDSATVRRRIGFRSAGPVTEVMVYDGVLDHNDEVVGKVPGMTTEFSVSDSSFVGRHFASWDDVRKAVREPWPEGAERVEKMTEALRGSDLPQPRSIRRKVRFSEDGGDEVCLDRYQEGRPYWRTTRREGSIGPSVLTVAVQIGAPAYRKSAELFWRGACAIALTELLEEAGYSVELWAYSYGQKVFTNGHNAFQAVRVKDGSDRIDVHALATATAGWYFRTMIFGGYYVNPATKPDWGLGFQAVIHRELLPYISAKPDNVMVIEECWNLDEAVKLAGKYLKQLEDGPGAIGGWEGDGYEV